MFGLVAVLVIVCIQVEQCSIVVVTVIITDAVVVAGVIVIVILVIIDIIKSKGTTRAR